MKSILLFFLGVSTCQGWLFFPNKKCYQIYGENECFSTKSPYTNTANKVPESPGHQQVSYLLYTPANPTNPQTLCGDDAGCLTSSNFDGTKNTRVLIHGFTDSPDSEWIVNIIPELLTQDGSNVIVVDWEKGADNSLINYLQSVANVRVAGALAAKLINLIVTTDTSATYGSFHLIGHSLGSHVAGEIGRRLSDNIGRITGLDPAGPGFEDEHTIVRLDSSDAQFVDVIHTDGKKLAEGGLGTLVEMGDADYYPNGGRNQPGCGNIANHILAAILSGLSGLTESFLCSHSRVTALFVESINSACSFDAVSCSSISAIKAKSCSLSGPTVSMGFHAPASARGKYYLETNANSPYCIN